MSEIQFDEGDDLILQHKIQNRREKPGIADLLIKSGIVKDKQQANLVMIGIIIFMAIIFFISISDNDSDTYNPATDDPTLYMETAL